MRTFGIIFLLAYLFDALFSAVSTVFPALEMASTVVSSFVSVTALLVLIFAALKLLRPWLLFLVTSAYHLFLGIVGTLLGVALVLKMGLQEMGREIVGAHKPIIAVLFEQLPWYPPVHYALLAIWLLLALYAVPTALRHRPGTSAATSPPPLPPSVQ